jgi:hypothetical protein
MALAFKGSIAKESVRVNNNHYDLRRTGLNHDSFRYSQLQRMAEM